MNRNFQAIAEPFQTGQVAVPRGLGLEVGIIAHTSPNELEDAILQMPHDATDGTRILASAVDREITRLGRRHQIAACAAGILLGAGIGMGAYKVIEPAAEKGVELIIGEPVRQNQAEHPSDPIAENALGVAAGIGVLAGGVFGYARNSTRYVQNAQRSAARRIARSTPPATE